MKKYKTLDNGVEIVEYEESLAAGIAEMWNQSWDSWDGSSELRTEEAELERHRKGAYYNVFVALHNGEVVGYCSFDRYYKDADSLYVHVLNVRPDYHSMKVGKALVLMCVERTIELGFPRLELHTWPGNTKAVPLYKKCGFMWEDASDRTVLHNFLPTVLAQGLLAPFFQRADWYSDSSRAIEIKPDGVKDKGFERFTYSWARDGETLGVSFEKTGGRLSLVETNDFLIEMNAENQELAYGFDYGATFHIRNKSGKPLNVSIQGKDDGAVAMDWQWAGDVEGEVALDAPFTLSKPEIPQDPDRIHPCVLAELTVNGLPLAMGLGIHVKPPVTLTMAVQGLTQPGFTGTAYLNMESSLLKGAQVTFTLPDNRLTAFDGAQISASIPAQGKAGVSRAIRVLAAGCEKLVIPCAIKLADGREASFDMPLDVLNQGMTGRFPCETEKVWGIACGPYRLEVSKNNNRADLRHAVNKNDDLPEFPASLLGKPYDDEFNLVKPVSVIAREDNGGMTLELSYLSGKQTDIIMTMIYTLSEGGVATRSHRVANTGDTARQVFLMERVYSHLWQNSVYHYDGRIVGSRNAADSGFDLADPGLIGENWAFEAEPGASCGVCWPAEYKASFEWADGVVIEHDLGELPPGGVFESKPVTVVLNGFRNYNDFRAFAQKTYNPSPQPMDELVEITVNGGNPFVTGDSLEVKVVNNRNRVLEGNITLTSGNEPVFAKTSLTNPAERVPETVFDLKYDRQMAAGGLTVAEADMDFLQYRARERRAVFFPAGDMDMTQENGVLTVNNGQIAFKADPAYFPGLFSLKDTTGVEWLMSHYPKLEPYSWFNPFAGGMYAYVDKMNERDMLKEAVTGGFTTVRDSLGNEWRGIAIETRVTNHKERKGLTLTQYFLTLPGVPVLCGFTAYKNNTGSYLDIRVDTTTLLNFGGEAGRRRLSAVTYGKNREAWLGNDFYMVNMSFATVTAENDRKLYITGEAENARRDAVIGGGLKDAEYTYRDILTAPDGGGYNSRPYFFVMTEKELTPEALRALTRIRF